MRIHGLEVRHGATAFAFLVLKLRRPSDRAALVDVIHQVASMIPDAEAFIAELPEDLEEAMRIVGMPWAPANDEDGVEEQRALLARLSAVEAAWFFQTGTGLPNVNEDDDAAGDNGDGDAAEDADEFTQIQDGDEGWGEPPAGVEHTGTQKILVEGLDDDDDDEDDEDDEDAAVVWSHGPPPQAGEVPFPVDGYPAILDELDWEDFGIAFKLAGAWLPGESTVLLGFHALWLAPYGGRYRNAAVTIDTKHHAAHLWVDRFAVPCSAAEQVHHLLWIVTKLHEVTPVVHARFAGATMAQKYGGLMGDTSEPFVLGGNPLNAVHARGGESGVDAWIDGQTDWSKEEVAQMLRELAIDLVTGDDDEDDDDDDLDDLDDAFDAVFADDDDDDEEAPAPPTGRKRPGETTKFVPSETAVASPPPPPRRRGRAETTVFQGRAEIASPEDDEDTGTRAVVDAGVGAEGDADPPRPLTSIEQVDDADDAVRVTAETAAVHPEDEDEAETADEDPEAGEEEADAADEGDDDDDDDDDDDSDDDDDDDEDSEDDGSDDGDSDEDGGRQITRYAGELLAARAAAGLLDPRVVARLRPVLDVPEKYEHRRRAIVEILGALKDRGSVPQLIKILDDTTISSSLDAIGKEDFIVKVATALGAISDPAAIPALTKVVRAAGDHNDEARAPAAEALAACLAMAPEPRDVDDDVLAALLAPIEERNDAEANADLHFAYGRLASVLAPARREQARKRLADAPTRRSDPTPTLARKASLLLAAGTSPDAAALAELRPLVHGALTQLDYAHEYTVRNIRTALRICEALPELVDPDDLVWLTRFAEPDLRSRAHALLARANRPLAPAPIFDRATAKALADSALVAFLEDPHLVGRAALISEAGRRKLAAARAAIIAATDAAITRARPGGANLLEPDSAILSAAVSALRTGDLHTDTIGLFDRMLRHSNHHVKWELLQDPPKDERLIGGMFHVLGEKWGWQETTAKTWLAEFQGTAAYEAERRRDDMN